MDTKSSPNERHADTPASSLGGMLHRRQLLAGSLATGVVAAGAFRIAQAQVEDAATPDATSTGTPAVETDQTAVSGNDDALSDEALTRADAMIRSVQTDRDSVAAGIDITDVDAILTQAGIHRDRAEAAIASGTELEGVREALVAGATARAARMLIDARLRYPGLPSQQTRSSRELVRAHETIGAVSTASTTAADTTVSFFIANAQDLYASAYELYGGGAFSQAAGTASTATSLARIVTLMMADRSTIGRDYMHRDGRDGGRMGPGGGANSGARGGMAGPDWPGVDQRNDADGPPFGADDDEPVSVPAPEF